MFKRRQITEARELVASMVRRGWPTSMETEEKRLEELLGRAQNPIEAGGAADGSINGIQFNALRKVQEGLLNLSRALGEAERELKNVDKKINLRKPYPHSVDD